MGFWGCLGFSHQIFLPHGQAPHMDLPLQWAPTWGGNRNPMKATWGLLSIHPAPLPCGAMPGVAGPLPAPGRLPCVSVGEPRGLAGSSVELLRMEKSPGSALSLRRHLSWEVFFFPSSQHGCLEISYAGSGCDVFITQRTVWQSPEKPFTN